MAKLLKENNNKFLTVISEFFKLRRGLERLLTSTFSIVLVTHIGACLWYILKV